MRNVQDKLPQRLQGEVRGRLRALTDATTQTDCEQLRDASVSALRTAHQGAAAETVLRDWVDCVTFYQFPVEHWVPLRTSNPLESVCAGVRLRTDATKRWRTRESAL